MVKIKLDVAEIMDHPRLTIKTVPWSDKPFISRLGFEKGKVPYPLEGYLIQKGECKGMKGYAMYGGRRVLKVNVCVAEKHAKKEDKKRMAKAAWERIQRNSAKVTATA